MPKPTYKATTIMYYTKLKKGNKLMRTIYLILIIFNTFYCNAQIYNSDGSIPKSDSVLFNKFIEKINDNIDSTINFKLKKFKKKHKQLHNGYINNFTYKSIAKEYHQFMKGHQIHTGLYANFSGFSYFIFGKIYFNGVLYLVCAEDYFNKLCFFIAKYDTTGTILDLSSLEGKDYYNEIIQFMKK